MVGFFCMESIVLKMYFYIWNVFFIFIVFCEVMFNNDYNCLIKEQFQVMKKIDSGKNV